MKNNRKKVKCVGTGYITLDIIRSSINTNTTIEKRYAGGTCANVLSILAYLGMKTQAVGRIGDDQAGKELLSDLSKCNVDVSLINLERKKRTPVIFQDMVIDRRGNPKHRFSRECPVCGTMMPGYRPILLASIPTLTDLIQPHHFFFFDRVSRGNLELARFSRNQGAFIFFEPSGVKDKQLFTECLETTHVLKYSNERLSGINELTRKARPPIEIKTYGEKGLQFRISSKNVKAEWKKLDALPAASIRDSAGSGDWCTAGFMTKLAHRNMNQKEFAYELDEVVEALRFGQALSALNCSFDGARGLMYAMSSAKAFRESNRLLSHEKPRLPKEKPLRSVAPPTKKTCSMCTSELQST